MTPLGLSSKPIEPYQGMQMYMTWRVWRNMLLFGIVLVGVMAIENYRVLGSIFPGGG